MISAEKPEIAEAIESKRMAWDGIGAVLDSLGKCAPRASPKIKSGSIHHLRRV
jgi:hypothetical protein